MRLGLKSPTCSFGSNSEAGAQGRGCREAGSLACSRLPSSGLPPPTQPGPQIPTEHPTTLTLLAGGASALLAFAGAGARAGATCKGEKEEQGAGG